MEREMTVVLLAGYIDTACLTCLTVGRLCKIFYAVDWGNNVNCSLPVVRKEISSDALACLYGDADIDIYVICTCM